MGRRGLKKDEKKKPDAPTRKKTQWKIQSRRRLGVLDLDIANNLDLDIDLNLDLDPSCHPTLGSLI